MNEDEFGGEICIANIGGRQRGLRLAFGLVMAAGAVLTTVALFAIGAPKPARLFVAPLVWLATIGILQYRGNT